MNDRQHAVTFAHDGTDGAVRHAQCACGAVRLRTVGAPTAVVACHCVACQRRTGSVLGVGAYFPRERVAVTGATRAYARTAASGRAFVTEFCPICGTSTHWAADLRPELIGIAVGAFADPAFPPPERSVWERSRHGWIDVAVARERHDLGRR